MLSVYTDSAFFPHLNYLDFRQEGHRLEFENSEQPESGLVYRGVVYNEMKGAMSNPGDAFMHKLAQNLFKDSQYRFNSGGEPRDIPDLTHEKLKEFHSTYYHPSNSTFFSYGDLDFTKHLQFVQDEVLRPHFTRNESIKSELTLEQLRSEPITKSEQFMPDLMSPPEQQCKLGLFFLLNIDPAADPYEAFCMHVLENIILEGPNAPFFKALVESGKAPSFCPGAGFDNTTRQATFTLGVQGVTEDGLHECEKIIFETLAKIAHDGVDGQLFE